MFQIFVNAEGCAEVILAVAKEKGFRIEIIAPDIQRPVRLRITAPSRAHYRAAREIWRARLTPSDQAGKVTISKWPSSEDWDRLTALMDDYRQRKGLPPAIRKPRTTTRSRL